MKSFILASVLSKVIRSRRQLIRIATFGLLIILVPSFKKADQIENPYEVFQPNIILLLTDDHRWDALGVAGNTIIQTPNLDRLARSGIQFQNAFVTSAICCVSRASILTGQYEAYHNIHDFSTDFSATALSQTYPMVLKKAGYQVGFIGKFGVGRHHPDSVFNFCMDTEAGGKDQPDYIVTDKNGKRIHDTDTISNSIEFFLDQFGRSDKPFCLSVSFKAPHEQDGLPPKYVVQERYHDYYKTITIPEPVTANPRYWGQFPDFFRTDSNFGRARWKGLFGTPELFQENVKNYYRLITGVDDVVGKIVQKLQELGIDKRTIIVFAGDNGMLLGEHGMEGKWYGYEESIRVPLVIFDPRLPDKLKYYKASQIALNIDIAPTILGMAGVEVPVGMQGVDLLRLVKNELPERNDFFYQCYFLASPRIPQVEGIVTKRFKYMKFIEHGYEELYDIKYDPHETINLVDDPKYTEELNSLRRRFLVLGTKYAVASQRHTYIRNIGNQ